jgi:hypothetical protein
MTARTQRHREEIYGTAKKFAEKNRNVREGKKHEIKVQNKRIFLEAGRVVYTHLIRILNMYSYF